MFKTDPIMGGEELTDSEALVTMFFVALVTMFLVALFTVFLLTKLN